MENIFAQDYIYSSQGDFTQLDTDNPNKAGDVDEGNKSYPTKYNRVWDRWLAQPETCME